jgi:hypothetical protein
MFARGGLLQSVAASCGVSAMPTFQVRVHMSSSPERKPLGSLSLQFPNPRAHARSSLFLHARVNVHLGGLHLSYTFSCTFLCTMCTFFRTRKNTIHFSLIFLARALLFFRSGRAARRWTRWSARARRSSRPSSSSTIRIE